MLSNNNCSVCIQTAYTETARMRIILHTKNDSHTEQSSARVYSLFLTFDMFAAAAAAVQKQANAN